VYIDPTYADFTATIDQYSSADYNVLKYRFRHTATFQCQTGFNKLNAGIATRYYSRMEAIDFVFEQLIAGVKDYRDNQSAGDWVWDVNADWKISQKLSLSLIARNLLNRSYSLRPGIMEPTRSWVVRLAFKG
jgi:outer membrane cobalamin receptor